MSETRYIISDAAKMIDVEPHVLRYWEEELGMEIPRNEMGHRYYTEREVKLFTMVRELKDKGFQLKAIKMVLSAFQEEIAKEDAAGSLTDTSEAQEEKDKRKGIISLADVRKTYDIEQNTLKEDMAIHTEEAAGSSSLETDTETDYLPADAGESQSVAVTAEDKMKHFKYMMDSIVMQALRKNNQTLEAELTAGISNKVIKEMDYLFRIQEEKEEERFRNIDELIRKKQKGRKEAAATKAPAYGPKKKKRLFGGRDY